MALTQLTLTDFRNHADLRLAAGTGFNVLTGPNGAGKTNILEAISLLSPGRGLRRASFIEMACDHGPGGFSVAAQLEELQLSTGTMRERPDRRATRINGVSAATADLADWLAQMWLTPAMDRLFSDAPGERRNFIDRLIMAVEPAHARKCSRYEAARRERNRLLSDDIAPDPQWLDALEQQLAEAGSDIAIARMRLTARLNGALRAVSDPYFVTAVLVMDNSGPCDVEALRSALFSNRRADRAAGRTLIGPHRADLAVTMATTGQAAAKCSTGEQKALLLAIILAHADLVAARDSKRPTILLLDEVAAHLDPARRAALFRRLADTGAQIWMTGTERGLFAELDGEACFFDLSDGMVATT